MNTNQYQIDKSKIAFAKPSKQDNAENWDAYGYSTPTNTTAQKGNDKLAITFNQEKKYTTAIHSKLETLFFRLDFIPTSDKLASEIVDFISQNGEIGSNKGRRNPDKFLLAQLDGDSIAEMLGVSLTDLYKYEITSFDDIYVGPYKCVICVHRYFVSLEIINSETEVKKEDLETGKLVDAVFSFFHEIVSNEFFRVFELDIYLGLSYRLQHSTNEILKLIDNTAFPILDSLDGVHDGLYRNITCKRNNPFVAVELLRSLKTIKCDTPPNNVDKACVIVQSRAVSEINDKSTYFIPTYDDAKFLLKKSIDSITRCFNYNE